MMPFIFNVPLNILRSINGVHGPQPDGGDKERCIAALNISFYNDGAKLHDIGCEHRKPVVCE